MADPGPGRLLTFVRELKRRHVVRVGVVYAVIGFSVLQVATNFFPALLLPAWTVTLVAVTPPMLTVAPVAKFEPRSTTGVPPRYGRYSARLTSASETSTHPRLTCSCTRH